MEEKKLLPGGYLIAYGIIPASGELRLSEKPPINAYADIAKEDLLSHSIAEKPALRDAIMAIDQSEELEHYGVLGMKWGVRKAPESSSGSSRRTKSGMKYFIKRLRTKARLKKARRIAKKKHQEALKKEKLDKKGKPIDVKSLSDAELKARIARIENEQKYLNLVSPKKKENLAKKVIKDALTSMVVNGATEFAKSYFKSLGEVSGNNLKDSAKKKKQLAEREEQFRADRIKAAKEKVEKVKEQSEKKKTEEKSINDIILNDFKRKENAKKHKKEREKQHNSLYYIGK